MKNLFTRVCTLSLFCLFLFSCEKENLNESLDPEPQKKEFILENGALKFENKDDLKLLVGAIKETGAENFYNKEIKDLTENGYEPLRPYFSEEETEEHEAFIEKKRE